jgi:HK97 family phage major capsid protein
VPFTLIQDSGLDIDGLVMRWLGEAIGRIYNEEATTTGTGNNMPEALVLQATSAATTASATAVTWEELLDLIYSVNRVYRTNARFMFQDATLKAIRKLKDGQGLPIWQPSIQAGEADRIFSYPYTINDDMPALAATNRAIAFGDFRAYKVRDVRGAQVLRLTERYAEYGQVAFLLFSRHDGILVDAGQHPVKVLTQKA